MCVCVCVCVGVYIYIFECPLGQCISDNKKLISSVGHTAAELSWKITQLFKYYTVLINKHTYYLDNGSRDESARLTINRSFGEIMKEFQDHDSKKNTENIFFSCKSPYIYIYIYNGYRCRKSIW